MVGPLALFQAPAKAQIERRELPPLPGIESAPSGPPAGVAPPEPQPATIAPGEPPPDYRQPPQGYAQPPPIFGQGSPQAGSRLPIDLFRGLQPDAMQRLLAAVTLPSPSRALATLIARALTTGAERGGADIAVRIEALKRAGRVEETARLLGEVAGTGEAGASARYAEALLAAGHDDEACGVALDPPPDHAGASETKRATFLVPAYCAARKDDMRGAQLSLQLARDNGVQAPLAFAAIDRKGAGSLPKRIEVLAYIFLRLDPKRLRPEIAMRATPDLLYRLAHDDAVPPELKLAAAERAAALNIVDGRTLAAAYRDAAPKLGKSQTPPALRARLFAALEAAPTAKIRADSIDALLVSGRELDLEIPLSEALAEANARLAQDPHAAAFAATGVRVAALAGDDQSAWSFIDAGGGPARSLAFLLAARDPFDPRASQTLGGGPDATLKGGPPQQVLPWLVTVLEALDYEVPIPLWDVAGKVPQPTEGYLPATGELTALKDAADAGELGRTVLLVASVLGPKGPAGANLIAVSDAIRALKRIGLDQEARQVGFEALYAHWPVGRA
jgi:hypothetical protein